MRAARLCRASLVIFLAAISLVAGCAGDLTEIVLEVQSDLEVPSQLDEIRVDVRRPGGSTQSATAELGDGEPALPRTLTLVHAGGPLAPVEVDVIARADGGDVVRRELSLAFDEGRSRHIVVFLASACRDLDCAAGQTCDRGTCRPVEVAPCELAGTGCLDAGLADAAPEACAPGTETCDGADQDCDGRVDEGFDLQADPMHCGACGTVCPTTGDGVARGVCESGLCAFECRAGFGDCNRDAADGCETDTDSSMMHCGGCGSFCPSAGTFHATDAVCSGGRCLLSCDVDWGDCDGDRSTGCETNLRVTRMHCGACGNVCPDGEMCVGGSCNS